ncbi:alpha/beta fold hydrolase, partial [Streptomyces sp. NRRL WC-3725]|uniref:alpha/beta fold hydrolase n=1 Tax=Streptomyces sp. NRRL WC-3725 TaxID=1463933 RepID=UPI0004C491A3
ALDIIALMDALKIHRAVFAGFDWGSRTADIIAALWPERVKALVSTATFDRTAQAFHNPDYAAIVLYNYRWRIGLIEGEARYDRYEKLLAAQPPIHVPTITLDPALDPFTPPGNGSAYRSHFTGKYEHRTIADVGHNLPQEAPTTFAQAVVDAARL